MSNNRSPDINLPAKIGDTAIACAVAVAVAIDPSLAIAVAVAVAVAVATTCPLRIKFWGRASAWLFDVANDPFIARELALASAEDILIGPALPPLSPWFLYLVGLIESSARGLF